MLHSLNRLLKRVKHFFFSHKILGAVILIVLVFGVYKLATVGGSNAETRYILAAAERGTLLVTTSGTGQVSAENQIEVKAKASADVVSVGVKNGTAVKAGAALVSLDRTDAEKTVRSAEMSLKNAELQLEKVLRPPETLTLIQSEHDLARANEAKDSAMRNLDKAYEESLNKISDAYLSLPEIMTGLQEALYTSTPGVAVGGQWNIDYYADAVDERAPEVNLYKADTNAKMLQAKSVYVSAFDSFKTSSRSSNREDIESLLSDTYETAKSISEVLKGAANLIQFYKDRITESAATPAGIADEHLTRLNGFTATINSILTDMLNSIESLRSYKEAIVNAERSIQEKNESHNDLVKGSDELEISSAQLSVMERENSLRDALENLTKLTVRSPIAGMVASMDVRLGDSVSVGSVVATVISKSKFAEISLNEVDVSGVKVGDRATLTFDALPDLSIAGEIAEIDALGTVSQGVVSYNVKISFDTDDVRIKPGMTVSASIITGMSQNALLVPAGALKNQGSQYYVEVLSVDANEETGNLGVVSNTPPQMKLVEVGKSNDASAEIISGLSEGETVVVRVITGSGASNAATPQSPNLFGGGSGGNIRMMVR